ncbi:MAG: hypothetical protein WD045_10210 [Pirellulaceae bacterium]
MTQYTTIQMNITLLLLLGLLIGCGGSDGTLSGSVSLDGEAVPEGSIAFIPAAGTKGPSIGGGIRKGKYHIPAENGFAAGSYRVEIRWPREAGEVELYPGSMGQRFEEAIPAKYNTQSTLEVQIDSQGDTTDFELSTSGGK